MLQTLSYRHGSTRLRKILLESLHCSRGSKFTMLVPAHSIAYHHKHPLRIKLYPVSILLAIT